VREGRSAPTAATTVPCARRSCGFSGSR